jgi:hypothetical protein
VRCVTLWRAEEKESSFSEEKEAKRLLFLVQRRVWCQTISKGDAAQETKVFLLLFLQKKKILVFF